MERITIVGFGMSLCKPFVKSRGAAGGRRGNEARNALQHEIGVGGACVANVDVSDR